MSHLEWQCVAKNKNFLGLTGHPLKYYDFSADATDAVQNFVSWLLSLPTSDPIPVGLAAIWYEAIVKSKYLKNNYYSKNGWELIQPNRYTNDTTMTADLPISLIRSSPNNIAFDHKVQDFINSVSVPDHEDSASSSDDEERVSKRKKKHSAKSSKKSRRKSYSSMMIQMMKHQTVLLHCFKFWKLLFAIPTFDAAGTLITLDPQKFMADI